MKRWHRKKYIAGIVFICLPFRHLRIAVAGITVIRQNWNTVKTTTGTVTVGRLKGKRSGEADLPSG
jgi:hypothetical protein